MIKHSRWKRPATCKFYSRRPDLLSPMLLLSLDSAQRTAGVTIGIFSRVLRSSRPDVLPVFPVFDGRLELD